MMVFSGRRQSPPTDALCLGVIVTVVMVAALSGASFGYIVDPGPVVKATRGEIWPKPKLQTTSERFFTVRQHTFRFNATNHTCDILNEAMERYQRIMSSSFFVKRKSSPVFNTSDRSHHSRHNPLFEAGLEVVSVNLKRPCEHLPYLGMDEAYTLNIRSADDASLEAYSVWGALRGLESFSQMLVLADDKLSFRINGTTIEDAPRFAHRGLLLDTSRHFIKLPVIKNILDGMAYTKLNVFHWHIVDDHSFPYVSIRYPELSEMGAYHPSLMVYTQADTAAVIEYARVRGIRVLVEFDTPGHTRSWGVSHPEILTACGGQYEGQMGPIDPTVEVAYEFIRNLLGEIRLVFPDQYVHLGGDEVEFECWKSNPNITAFMNANSIETYEALEELYIQRIVRLADAANISSIVWQEVFTNGVQLSPETVVHVWTGNTAQLLNQITHQNLSAILSSCWYLDHLKTGGDWYDFYSCDPHDFPGSAEQKARVLGGEACMWSESVDSSNVVQRIFPRACASAEKLWSPKDATTFDEAARRLEEHTCRMQTRGVAAQPPNGPGFCL